MPELAPFQRSERIRLQAKHRSLNSVPEASPGRFHFHNYIPVLRLAVTGLTLLRDAGHSTTSGFQPTY
jgi:6-pyruvoyl-tetrahydropterin synthase